MYKSHSEYKKIVNFEIITQIIYETPWGISI